MVRKTDEGPYTYITDLEVVDINQFSIGTLTSCEDRYVILSTATSETIVSRRYGLNLTYEYIKNIHSLFTQKQ